MRLIVCLLLTTLANADEPKLSPLRADLTIGRAEEANALGWRVTAAVNAPPLEGHVCQLRFVLRQGDKNWEETRQRPLHTNQWEENAFYKQSFLRATFDVTKPVEVTFSIVDSYNHRQLAQVSGDLPADPEPPLVAGGVDWRPDWERIQKGEIKARTFDDLAHRLPRHPRGYWKQYSPKGKARLIAGSGGELYFTSDGRKLTELR